MTPAPDTQRIKALDGWRGIAIILVLVNHLASYQSRIGWVSGVHVGGFTVSLGGFGVDAFFVLSGFVITLQLLKEWRLNGLVNLQAFYVRRVFRILPPALAYLVALCLLSRVVVISDFRWVDIVGSLFFFRNYQTWYGSASVYTAHFWSLAIEEQFYLFWPGLLVLAGRRKAFFTAVAAALLCALWRYHDVSTLASFHWSWIHPSGTTFPVRTDVRADGLLLGAAAAIAANRPSVRKWLERQPSWMPVTAVLLALAGTKHFGLQPSLLANALLAFAVGIVAFQQRGVVRTLLNFRPLVWIGELSYGIYIWQQLFLLRPVDRSLPLGRVNLFPWNILLSFALAACSYYLLDRTFIPIGRRWSRQHTARRSAPVLNSGEGLEPDRV